MPKRAPYTTIDSMSEVTAKTTDKNNVLIIDDEEMLVEAMREKLLEEGMRVSVAHNGLEGLEIARREHPDVILLDILMPEMDGFDFLDHLHEDEWGRRVQVIILTNSTSFQTLSRAVASGMSEFVIKSEVQLDDIVDKVKTRLSNNMVAQPDLP